MKTRAVVLACAICIGAQPALAADDVLESLPDEVLAAVQEDDRQLLSIRVDETVLAPQLVASLLKLWKPGQTIRVAFKGGDAALHKKIADVASQWTLYANIKFDFGGPGEPYRMWSTADTEYAAEIRVSFDAKGYWSVVGNNSININIVGPGTASLNLMRFDAVLPDGWEGVVLHEFGHALGAEHEHQHPTQGCDSEFRWYNDDGYETTKDSLGRYIADAKGRRPGIYTRLSGYPNYWSIYKVDFNMRQLPNSAAYSFGAFDVESIMKYHFADWMFRNGVNSQCYSRQENLALSAEDKTRIAVIYPADSVSLNQAVNARLALIANLLKTAPAHHKSKLEHLQQMMR